MGLGEMFPQPIRTVTSTVAGFSWNSAKWLYSAGRVGAWVAASSAVILALPVMFESERAQMEEHQLQQQRQVRDDQAKGCQSNCINGPGC